MSDLRFSIVIPTRERADTLRYTLRTCLAQEFDSYEIVVCDNCGSAATKETVESFKSRKIKYIRSDRPLAMSENWELAVSHANGEYVIVIGDDDGLLLHALCEVDRLFQMLGVKALRWERVYYSWPNMPIVKHANKLSVPLVRESSILRAHKVIPKVANYRMGYTMLPMLYNSAIHQDLVALLRQKAGHVFGASSPDVYSGFAFAYLTQSYASIGRPMSINAGSAKSTGVNSVHFKGNSSIAQEFRTLNTAAGLGCHSQIPDIPVMPATIADAFQHAKDALFPDDPNLYLDRKQLVINCVQVLRADSEEEWRRNLLAIRDSLADDVKLQAWFDFKFLNRCPFIQSSRKCSEWKKGFDGKNLHIDASEFGVTDVFGVAELCDKLLGYRKKAFEWSEQGKWLRRLRSAARILIKG